VNKKDAVGLEQWTVLKLKTRKEKAGCSFVISLPEMR
jgi:hypothetical protein